MSELESGFRVADVTALLRRRRIILVVAAVVGLVLGALAFSTSPTRYSATARVQVAIADPDASAKDLTAQRQTQADLVKSDEVGGRAIKALGLDITEKELFSALTLTVKDTSDVIALTYEAWEPEEAQERVNAIAEAYLQMSTADARATQEKLVETLQERILAAERAKDAAADDIEATEPGTADRIDATRRYDDADTRLRDLNLQLEEAQTTDPEQGARLVGAAPLPKSVLSKMAVAKGVGVFGLSMLAGLGLALVVDRRDSLGGGRRRVEQLIPGVTIRLLPTATKSNAHAAEIDAAVDRLAIDLTAGSGPGRAASAVLVGTLNEPPIELADQLSSSLAFAGVPALFVVAGPANRPLDHVHVVTAFADLIDAPSITGPAGLPEEAGADVGPVAPTVTWLRPRGSVESSGLLRRAVVDSLIARAGRDGFDVVIFVSASPTRNAAAAALGQWVGKALVIVEDDESAAVEAVVGALQEADVAIDEVVWT